MEKIGEEIEVHMEKQQEKEEEEVEEMGEETETGVWGEVKGIGRESNVANSHHSFILCQLTYFCLVRKQTSG